MPRPDEGLIHEWLDGELPPEEAARIARLVAEDPEWSAAAAEARGFMAAATRILGGLDSVPGGVMPANTANAGGGAGVTRDGNRARSASAARFTVRPWMKIAAGVVLVAGLGIKYAPRSSAPEAEDRAETALATARSTESAAVVASTAAGTAVESAPARETATANAVRQERATTGGTVGSGSDLRADEVARADARAAALADSRAAAGSRMTELAGAEARASAAKAAEAPPPPAVAAAPAPAPAPALQVTRDAALPERATVASLRARSALSAQSLSTNALEGCWRTATTAAVERLLITPPVLRTLGDSLVLLVAAPARMATVLRVGDRISGTTLDSTNTRVPFVAERVDCPPSSR